MSEIITAQEAANFIRVDYRTLLKYAREGKIPSLRIGGFVRFLRTDLETWLRSHRVAEQVIDDSFDLNRNQLETIT